MNFFGKNELEKCFFFSKLFRPTMRKLSDLCQFGEGPLETGGGGVTSQTLQIFTEMLEAPSLSKVLLQQHQSPLEFQMFLRP